MSSYYDYYYDNYYYAVDFTVTSIHPGNSLLIITTGYTIICLLAGFLFHCRKKKWRKNEEKPKGSKVHTDTHTAVQNSYGSTVLKPHDPNSSPGGGTVSTAPPSPLTPISMGPSWACGVDPSAYVPMVDGIVLFEEDRAVDGIALFEDDRGADGGESVGSDGSSKAYEDLFGADEEGGGRGGMVWIFRGLMFMGGERRE